MAEAPLLTDSRCFFQGTGRPEGRTAVPEAWQVVPGAEPSLPGLPEAQIPLPGPGAVALSGGALGREMRLGS